MYKILQSGNTLRYFSFSKKNIIRKFKTDKVKNLYLIYV